MKRIHLPKLNRSILTAILDVLKFVLVLILLVMFVNFNTRIANQSTETKNLTENTNKVVKSQADILQAIKKVTSDTNYTADQQTAIIICMLQVPRTERTTVLQDKCREQATKTDSDNTSGTVQSSAGTSNPSSSQNTPPDAPKQPTTSQNQQSPEETAEPVCKPVVTLPIFGTVYCSYN